MGGLGVFLRGMGGVGGVMLLRDFGYVILRRWCDCLVGGMNVWFGGSLEWSFGGEH